MTNHLSQIEKYYFDDLDQLIQADYANGDVQQWSYDDIGNRTRQVVTPFGQAPIVTNYIYYQNAQAKNSQLLPSDGVNTFTWDNNGNLLTKGANNYTWDYDDRLVGISGPTVNAAYVYDYTGRRTKKTVTGTETNYYYNNEDIVKETVGGTVADYLHGIGIDEPVMMDRAGVKSYYYRDGLGSIREIADSAGTVQNSYTYGAWGEVRNQSAAVPNSYGYTGREFEEEGLYFYRARYMDAGVGRFVSEDPASLLFIVDLSIFTPHLYSYVVQNPINRIDPFGLFCLPYPSRKSDWETVYTSRPFSEFKGLLALNGRFYLDCEIRDKGEGSWEYRDRRKIIDIKTADTILHSKNRIDKPDAFSCKDPFTGAQVSGTIR